MDTMVGSIRGLGYSVIPMCVSLLGACGLRIVWIFTVFQVYHNLTVLYLSYPFTWIVTATARKRKSCMSTRSARSLSDSDTSRP